MRESDASSCQAMLDSHRREARRKNGPDVQNPQVYLYVQSVRYAVLAHAGLIW